MINNYVSEGVAEYVIRLFPNDFKGICIDVGAYAPFFISNSWPFEAFGWEVFCIEPNPHRIAELKLHRKHVYEVACWSENKDNVPFYIYSLEQEAACTGFLDQSEGPNGKYLTEKITVNAKTLDWLIENEFHVDHVDFLSIDAEGSEPEILKGFDIIKYNPKVIVVEDINYLTLKDYIESFGYHKTIRLGANDIYVKN